MTMALSTRATSAALAMAGVKGMGMGMGIVETTRVVTDGVGRSARMLIGNALCPLTTKTEQLAHVQSGARGAAIRRRRRRRGCGRTTSCSSSLPATMVLFVEFSPKTPSTSRLLSSSSSSSSSPSSSPLSLGLLGGAGASQSPTSSSSSSSSLFISNSSLSISDVCGGRGRRSGPKWKMSAMSAMSGMSALPTKKKRRGGRRVLGKSGRTEGEEEEEERRRLGSVSRGASRRGGALHSSDAKRGLPPLTSSSTTRRGSGSRSVARTTGSQQVVDVGRGGDPDEAMSSPASATARRPVSQTANEAADAATSTSADTTATSDSGSTSPSSSSSPAQSMEQRVFETVVRHAATVGAKARYGDGGKRRTPSQPSNKSRKSLSLSLPSSFSSSSSSMITAELAASPPPSLTGLLQDEGRVMAAEAAAATRGFPRSTAEILNIAYDRCGVVCKEYAKTFFLGTALMTAERRRAIWAIYVWCRRTDELVDGPHAGTITPGALDRWEGRLEDIFAGKPYDMLDAALFDTVDRFPVDIQPFRDMIDGMRMDLTKKRYRTFDELYLYCYNVAGTVGVMSTPVMGIDKASTASTESVYSAALALGIANQLTNILRDVGEDARRGRIYLPLEELESFGLTEKDIFAGEVTPRWREFMRFQIRRARKYFREAEKGAAELTRESRWPVWASLMIYGQILDAIEANDFDNFSKRAYVGKWRKIVSLPQAYLRAMRPPPSLRSSSPSSSSSSSTAQRAS